MADWLRIFKWPIAATVTGLAAATAYGGFAAFGAVAILIALETTVSFDNAVVNAGVLRELGEHWRHAFLTVGVLIAVFGMRVLFPLAIVSFATGTSIAGVAGQALHEREAYASNVESAESSSRRIRRSLAWELPSSGRMREQRSASSMP